MKEMKDPREEETLTKEDPKEETDMREMTEMKEMKEDLKEPTTETMKEPLDPEEKGKKSIPPTAFMLEISAGMLMKTS